MIKHVIRETVVTNRNEGRTKTIFGLNEVTENQLNIILGTFGEKKHLTWH